MHYGKTVRVTYPAFGYCLLRTERILSFNLQFPKRIAYQHQPGLIQSWKVLKTFQAGKTKLVVKHLKMITWKFCEKVNFGTKSFVKEYYWLLSIIQLLCWKVSWFQKDFLVSSFGPKNQRIFLRTVQIKKLCYIVMLNSPYFVI